MADDGPLKMADVARLVQFEIFTVSGTRSFSETTFRTAMVQLNKGTRAHEARGPRENPHRGADRARW